MKKIYFTKIDPLLFVALHSSLVVSSVLYEAAHIKQNLVLLVLLMHFSFLSGLIITHLLSPYNYLLNISKSQNRLKNSAIRRAMFMLCFLYIIYGTVIWLKFGLLIFADDPEYYKLQFAAGGLGFISRIAAAVILPLFFLIILDWEKCSWRCRIIPIITLILAVASSGKSILIQFIIIGLIVSVYKTKVLREKAYQSYAKLALFGVLAIGFAMFVLYLAYGDALNSDGQLIFLSFFLERISTAPGLGLVTYLQNMSYFDGILKGDVYRYIWNYLIVPIMAPLRLVEYVPTVGREIGIYITGAEDYGPNPTFYGEGFVYFGVLFGWFYAFAIGCLISILRYLAVTAGVMLSPIVGALVFAYLYFALLALSTDFLVFMAMISSYSFFIFVVYICLIFMRIVKVATK